MTGRTKTEKGSESEINLECLHPVAIHPAVGGGGGFFRLCTITIAGFFYYLLLLKFLYVLVVRPSSGRNIFARIYSTDNGSVVFRGLIGTRSYRLK
jgi:hypothetical protein